MRIVVLGTRGFPRIQGGVEVHCENLYPLLVELGCEVIVLGREPYVGKNPYSHQGVRIVPLPAVKNKFLEAFLHTFIGIFAACKYHPDILHIHAIGPGFFVPLARLLGFRVVLTTHGENYKHLKWGRFARLFLRMSEALAVVSASKVIVISKVIAAAVKRKFGRDSTIIPNGVKRISDPCSDQILQKFDLKKGRYILTVGRFVPEKGYHDLVAAFKAWSREQGAGNLAGSGEPRFWSNKDHNSVLPALTSKFPITWKLVIVGDADHEDDYSRKLKADAEAVPGVVLTGRLTGAPLFEIYSNAGLFVLPSYYEGLPIVLLEAMSYGLNCIVSDIPANREVALDASRYFQPGDIEGLAARLSEFTRRPLSPSERATQLELIAREYDWGVIAQRTLQVYKSLSESIR